MAAEMEALELRVRVPLPSVRVARVALGALGPDLQPLPRPGGSNPLPHPSPHLRCCGEQLEACWVAAGARGLRGGVTSFLELLGLVLETIERFGVGEGRDDIPPSPPPPFPMALPPRE
ncbi:hypothetical protein GRJ2_002696200 [Grus japonensis]|uniref:Uncharacterized protein n=1 Tax=Grus japonensis TaxID=30415 RepID=A0ABC9XYB2_GRUJA